MRFPQKEVITSSLHYKSHYITSSTKNNEIAYLCRENQQSMMHIMNMMEIMRSLQISK